MIIKEAINEIINSVKKIQSEIDYSAAEKMVELILNSENVFVIGAGRSGLVAKAFAMRLMHLGISVYVVGETITPAIRKGDSLIAISGSGETIYVVNAAKIAKKRGSKIISITSYPNSTLGKLSDLTIIIKGRTKIDKEKDYLTRQIKGQHISMAPLGTIFEISCLVFLDGVVAELMTRMSKTEEDLRKKHNVLE